MRGFKSKPDKNLKISKARIFINNLNYFFSKGDMCIVLYTRPTRWWGIENGQCAISKVNQRQAASVFGWVSFATATMLFN